MDNIADSFTLIQSDSIIYKSLIMINSKKITTYLENIEAFHIDVFFNGKEYMRDIANAFYLNKSKA